MRKAGRLSPKQLAHIRKSLHLTRGETVDEVAHRFHIECTLEGFTCVGDSAPLLTQVDVFDKDKQVGYFWSRRGGISGYSPNAGDFLLYEDDLPPGQWHFTRDELEHYLRKFINALELYLS